MCGIRHSTGSNSPPLRMADPFARPSRNRLPWRNTANPTQQHTQCRIPAPRDCPSLA